MTKTTTTVTEIRKEQRDTALTEALAYLWERSVRASHNFLKECDIANLKPYVKEALQAVGTLLVAHSGQECAAFCGIDLHIYKVDVNEQNPKAAGFYRRMGFEEYRRDETDDQGNPFPILRMRLK